MLSVQEAADRLGVNQNVIYRLIHAGDLPAYRRPGYRHYLIDESALADALRPVPVEAATGPATTISVTAAAKRLACDTRTVRRLIHAGEIEAMRFPGSERSHLRVMISSVEAYRQRSIENARISTAAN